MTNQRGLPGDPAPRVDAQAVFLSYASEDAPAAERICASLRSAGIEVWFDRSELRGGDAWDATIRKQIKSCALFVPIVSKNSHLRAEGYFRLEWKLAVDRSHLMAADRAFLVPVVIDDTTIADGRVPDRFRELQWIRLPRGETSRAFIEQVTRLLSPVATPRVASERTDPAVEGAAPADATDPRASLPATPPPPARRASLSRPRALWLSGAVVAIAIAIVTWIAIRHLGHADTVVPYSLEDRRMTFAVLPFEAPTQDAHALQAARATTDAVETALEAQPILAQTASRRSVEKVVAHLTGAKEIATALNVHFLVRGTLARAASGYTVNLVALDGATEQPLGTASLTIPTDALVPRWHDDVADATYHLIVAGLDAEVRRALDKPATSLDVRDLSFRAYSNWRKHRGKEAKEGYASATQLLNSALRLAPDDPLATYLTAEINLCDCVMAWSQNVEEQKAIGAAALEKYLRVNPDDPYMLGDKAQLFQLRGRYDESAVITDTILKRDPENAFALALRAVEFLRLGRARDAVPIADELFARYPDKWPSVTALAADVHYAAGDYAGAARLARNAAARMSAEDLRSPVDGPVRLTLAAAEARLGHRDRADAALADFNAAVPNTNTLTLMRKWIYPTANLANFEPLFEGLRIAGVRE